MCANLELYNKFRACPPEAQRPINAGRLKGKTDINPMWRLKVLTEAFGPCGFGWTLRIVRTWIEDSRVGAEEKTANVEVELRYKLDGEWSEPIPGIGGAMFVEQERNGLHIDDESYKKAYTDAISVACKALGVAADIYYAKDPDSKYPTGDGGDCGNPQNSNASIPPPEPGAMTYEKALEYIYKEGKYPDKTLAEIYKTDIAYINELGNSDATPEIVKLALGIISDKIREARAAKRNEG